MAEKLKLNYKKTLLIGCGFMSSSIAWAIYDPLVPLLLNKFLSGSTAIANWSASVGGTSFIAKLLEAQGEDIHGAGGAFTLVPLFIGIIMTFDNIFGVIFQPLFGRFSDHCRSKYGKRRPFIFIGAPISAILFALMPQMNSLGALMTCLILFVFVMSLWRAPVVALMPDLTPPQLRSEGNAIINLCGGLGGLIGMMAGTVICALFGLDSAKMEEFPYVFGLAAIFMLGGTLVLRIFVQEPDSRLKLQAEENKAQDEASRQKALKEAEKAEKERMKAMKLSSSERRSLIFMLGCLFFLFCSVNAIQTFFSLFAAEILGKTGSQATMMMAIFAACSMLAAIPAGKVGKKIGRKKTILLGLVAIMVVFALYAVTKNMGMIWVALVVGGAANMFITVNTLPLVLEIGGLERVGTFTGYYYTATFSAQIVTPIVYGVVRVFSGTYMSLFYYCPVLFVISLLCLLVVRHGEVNQEELEKVVEQVELENAD